jgi:hypothetical protein
VRMRARTARTIGSGQRESVRGERRVYLPRVADESIYGPRADATVIASAAACSWVWASRR